MADQADLLFELGTEELPPTALKRLSDALTDNFIAGLDRANLAHGKVTAYATPRRLALLVADCAVNQPDREIERRGPAAKAAYDKYGNPTKAAEGFARSCGTTVDQLEKTATDKGEWLSFRLQEKGRPALELLPGIADEALNQLPIPKRMRWGDLDSQFVRPVHWLLFLHGETVVPCTLLDAEAGRHTHGHRFHHPEAISVTVPGDYAALLASRGRVIAGFEERREKIRNLVTHAAESLGGHAEIDEELLDEVTGLVEWPVPITAGFEERYLEVPHEALILTMKKNQKYFHLVDDEGRLINHFITLSNIDSPRPELIKEGNERVVRPRLSDAMFFWQQDGRRRLEEYQEALRNVVFQQKLGSMYEKSERIAALAGRIALQIGGDPALATRAGMLSRCDLMTEMVGEFPDMQGIMGRYQALRDGEPEELAAAMDEFYMPRFSGDRLPQSRTGIAVSLAERLDTLVGIFGIGQRPTGDKDPFALRRAALGALRIMREHALPLDLPALLETAAEGLSTHLDLDDTVSQVGAFMLERLRGIYHEEGIPLNTFDAVAAVAPPSIADFDRRIGAITRFSELPAAESLAAANKRIRNILKKSTEPLPEAIDPDLFEQEEERTIFHLVGEMHDRIEPMLQAYDYTHAMVTLAELREPVDAFFDRVMVMAEDARLRANRLALLERLGRLFLGVADISRLQS